MALRSRLSNIAGLVGMQGIDKKGSGGAKALGSLNSKSAITEVNQEYASQVAQKLREQYDEF